MSIKGIASLADLMEDLPAAGSQEVALSLIDPDPHQPRTSFDELRLDTLAASVAAQGVIEPLIVSRHPETPGRYFLVAGERRWRAAGMAGLTTVAVVIREFTAEQRLAVQLVENIDREALSILEESSAVARLIEFGRKPKDVAGMLGKTQAWVSLRRKIADHRRHLEYFVAEDRTRVSGGPNPRKNGGLSGVEGALGRAASCAEALRMGRVRMAVDRQGRRGRVGRSRAW